MARDKALLWRTIDAAERRIAPPLESAVRSAGFAEVLGVVTRAQSLTRRQLEAGSRKMWHRVNLPAASDVTRLRRQIASLEREMHSGRVALEQALSELHDLREEVVDGRALSQRRDPGAEERAGPDAARRGAQRAPRP